MRRGLRPPARRPTTGYPVTTYYSISGGEDLISPPIEADPGNAIYTINYECDVYGRPRRIDGYEVFDGHPEPSEASYWILNFTDGNEELSATTIVTGATSSATGEIVSMVLESGTYAGGDASGYMVLTAVNGTFQDAENLQVSAVTKAVSDGEANERYATTQTLDETYLQAAIEAARDKISAVPGSGDVLGVWEYNGVKYAFRNNSGGTAAVMYKSTTAGWSACDLGETIAFTSGGTTEIEEDDIVEGATSGAYATVKRVILSDGTWAGGDAEGTLILYSKTGTFQSENLDIQGGASNVATIAGDSTAITLSPSGRYEFANYNFYGSSDYYRMYGVDGVNPGFEWDGDTFVQISTGMTTDTPTHLAPFKYHLFYSFIGGSLQHSSIGAPYTWSAVTGASELGVGDDITGLSVTLGGTLLVLSRNSTHTLSGTSVSDWVLEAISESAGAIEWTVQDLFTPIYIDDRGITTLSTVSDYGDFKSNTIADKIRPFVEDKLDKIQCCARVRSKNQYRVFYNDKYVSCLTFNNNKLVGCTRFLFDVQAVCCASCEDSSGDEDILFGDEDGYVYKMDTGTSFNGNAIPALIKTHYNHFGHPTAIKRFRKVFPEVDGPIDTELYVFASYSYGESEGDDFDIQAYSGGGIIGVSEIGNFRFGGAYVGSGAVKITGSGTNIAFTFKSETIYTEPHTLQGITVQYDLRRSK